MRKLLLGIIGEIKKDSFYPWWRSQGAFLFISLSLHMLIILFLFHLPLYSQQFSLPKMIEVKIIEEKNKVDEIPKPKIDPVPLLEKTKKVVVTKLKKAKPLEEKITPAPNPVSQPEKVILDNLDMELAKEYASWSKEDESWAKEKIMFPEKNVDANTKDAPKPTKAPQLAMAANSLPGEGMISEKTTDSPALPGVGSESRTTSSTSTGSVWLEGGNYGKGNIMRPPSGNKDGDSKVGDHPNIDKSPGLGYSKVLGKKGNDGSNFSTFLGLARKKIEEAKRYPWEALRRHWEGKVILSFWVDQKGEIRDIKILQSSGYKILDEEAKATLLRASPLPIPPQMEEDSFKIEVPILFRIE